MLDTQHNKTIHLYHLQSLANVFKDS